MPSLPAEETTRHRRSRGDRREARCCTSSGCSTYETDCWDVHAAFSAGHPGFVVLDVRSPRGVRGRARPGAAEPAHRRINERNLAAIPGGTLFVVYCSGPQCNGADRAAIALARLGRPVKKMIGGITGWKDEIELATGQQ